jgi:hypothetical protein
MKTVRLLPLAYLAGVDGFALFAPYLATFLVVVHVLRVSRAARLRTDQIETIPNFER